MAAESFADTVAIVTGASSGIGRAIVLRLADERARLVLAARDANRLDGLANECRGRGAKAIAVPTDVAQEGQCRALVERACVEYGRVDTLVNNAGITVVGKLDELPDLRLFRQVVDVNFYGAVHCTFYALPYLKQAKGRIVNISSLGGKLAIPYNTPYIASKFAMEGFSESLRMELADTGVSVTVICPYWVVTEFHERYMDSEGRPKGPSGRAIYTKKTMSADRCAQIVLKAARLRKREVLMGPGTFAVWLKLIAPSIMDKITMEAVLRPAIKRAAKGQRGLPLKKDKFNI